MVSKIKDKFKNRHSFAILVLAVLSLVVTFSNLGITKEFVGDDASVSTHFPKVHLVLATNMWDSYNFPGRSNVAATTGLVHVLFVNFLHLIAISSVAVDRILYFFIFFASGLGMYLLASKICGRSDPKNDIAITISSLMAAIFYMFNNYTMFLTSFPPTNYVYSYILLPWFFLLYLCDYHISEKLWQKLIFALATVLLFCGNPANTISIFALVIFYELFFRKENKIRYNLKQFFATAGLVVLLSLYVFLPSTGNKGNPYGVMSADDLVASISYNSAKSSLASLFRLTGQPSQSNYVFNDFLQSKTAIFVDYFLVIFALLPLLKKRINKFDFFLYCVLLVSIFLAKSIHPPFGFINNIILMKIPFFGIFRANYYKFVYFSVFSLALLLSSSALEIYKVISSWKVTRFWKNMGLILPFVLAIVAAWPFFEGIVAVKFHKTDMSEQYFQFSIQLSGSKKDSAVLALPQYSSGATYDWGNGNFFASGNNPDYFFANQPVWLTGWFLNGNLNSTDLNFYKKMLPLTDIKFILLHKDIPDNYSFDVNQKGELGGQVKYQELNSQIEADPDFKLVEDNQYFRLFELDSGLVAPHLYIATAATNTNQTIESFLTDLSAGAPGKNSAIYFQDQNPSLSAQVDRSVKVANEQKNSSGLSFERINPVKYSLSLSHVSGDVPLVFSESFQVGWKLYMKKYENSSNHIYDTWFHSTVADDSHLMVNGYANSWTLNTDQLCANSSDCTKNSDGTYNVKLDLEFWPQRLYYLGVFVSGGTLLICLFFISYQNIKKRQNG